VRLAGGLVRRLLFRALLVLGGAFAVTMLGWLLGAASASADVLPQVPPIPQVLGAVAPQLSTPDLSAARALPPALPCSYLDTVAKQVHVTVSDVGAKVTPTVAPATMLAHHVVPEAPAMVTAPLLVAPSAAAPVVVTPPLVVLAPRSLPVGHRHGPVVLPGTHRPVPVPVHDQPHPVHHSPAMPAVPPAGSSDAGAHGPGTVAAGAGADVSISHVASGGRYVSGVPDTSRLAAALGKQPGTSPD
jgi:hypothetical protein